MARQGNGFTEEVLAIHTAEGTGVAPLSDVRMPNADLEGYSTPKSGSERSKSPRKSREASPRSPSRQGTEGLAALMPESEELSPHGGNLGIEDISAERKKPQTAGSYELVSSAPGIMSIPSGTPEYLRGIEDQSYSAELVTAVLHTNRLRHGRDAFRRLPVTPGEERA